MIQKFIAILFLTIALTGADCVAQSKEQLYNRDAEKLVNELREMLAADQEFRGGSRDRQDSNAAAIAKTEDANTARMIEIIRTYGFPSMERTIAYDAEVPAFVLLMHAPQKYFDTLKPLLKTELEAARISTMEYEQIMGHLDGKVAVPGNEIEDRSKGRNSSKYKEHPVPRGKGRPDRDGQVISGGITDYLPYLNTYYTCKQCCLSARTYSYGGAEREPR